MNHRQAGSPEIKRWTIAVLSLTLLALALWVATSLLDVLASAPNRSLLDILLQGSSDADKYVLTSIGQSLAAVLGITMMLVLLVVQLAAGRYSHSIIQLYVEDRVNLFLISLFVGSIVYSFWVANTIKEDFVPTLGVLTTLVLATACFVSLVPYFHRIFGFLEPTTIIARLEAKGLEALGSGKAPESALQSIGRIASTSVSHMETDVAVRGIRSLEALCCQQLREGPGGEGRAGLETGGLNILNQIYNLALNQARDVTNAVASSARAIAQVAAEQGRREDLEATVKLFNTMLRAGINQKDRLTTYHLLHQYRLLAEWLLAQRDEMVLSLLFYFKYYAAAAQAGGVAFIVDTVAYDFNILCQRAWEGQSPLGSEVLEAFMGMDTYLECQGQGQATFPVYKMYGVLASYFLANGAADLSAPLMAKLRALPTDRLATLRMELLGPTQPFFWEFTERKVNFDYIDQRQKEALRLALEGSSPGQAHADQHQDSP